MYIRIVNSEENGKKNKKKYKNEKSLAGSHVRHQKKRRKKCLRVHGTKASYLRDGGPGKRNLWLKDANLVSNSQKPENGSSLSSSHLKTSLVSN